MNVLVVNSGSSSLKFQVISTDLERIKEFKDIRLCRGEVEGIGGEAIITFKNQREDSQKFTAPLRDIGCVGLPAHQRPVGTGCGLRRRQGRAPRSSWR